MKTSTLFFFAFLTGMTILHAQQLKIRPVSETEKSALARDLVIYRTALQSKNWDEVLRYLYSGLYNLNSREEIRNSMEKGTENPVFRMELQPASDLRIFPDVVEKDGKKYMLAAYTHNFTMIFKQRPKENDMLFKERMNYTYHQYRRVYPAGQLLRSEKEGVFHFRVPKYILAVYDPSEGHFTFTDIDDNSSKISVLKKILPADVVDYFVKLIVKDRESRNKGGLQIK